MLSLTFLLLTAASDPWLAAAPAMAQRYQPTYEWLHAHPELSGGEIATARKLADELRALGAEVTEGIGGQGVVALLRNRKQTGPVVLYHVEMDALPLIEATGLPYASQSPGIMHACGHDLHMAVALGTLASLRDHEDAWRGTILFVAQPAEETAQGAMAMLLDPRWGELIAAIGKPKVWIGLHDDADMPAGQVGVRGGAITANVDSLDVVLYGTGSHASHPEGGVDAVVMAAEVVMQLQTIVSRRLPPGSRAVLTVGQLEAGTKRNIIASRATLRLTMRSDNDIVRQRLIDETRAVASAVATAYHAPLPPHVERTDERVDAVVNDPVWAERMRTLFVGMLGSEAVQHIDAGMEGEDVGAFSKRLGCPGIYLRLGAVAPAAWSGRARRPLPSLHSEAFVPDVVPTLRTGVALMAAALANATGD